MRRREFMSFLGGAAVAIPLSARAQPANFRRVGVLLVYDEGNKAAQGLLSAFRETLGRLGWTDGKNIKFEYRWVGPDTSRMEQAAEELVALRPDLILVPSSSTATGLLLQQTRTIPIVFVNIVDPVGQGFVASLSRPGGNATGLVNLETSMAGKWIELLKQVMPRLARLAVPFNSATSPYAELYLGYFRSTAPNLGVEVIAGPVPDMAAFETFVAAQAHEPNTGLVPIPSIFMSGHISEITSIITRYSLPAIYSLRGYVEAGGLMSYGNDVTDNYRRAATFVDNILKGQSPSEIPVQFPTKFELVINLKTAKALGLTIPPSLLATADAVIE
jgi:putative ABC transport system substrate-binding protein